MLKKHVLVMSFLGQDGQPAPKLKEAAERMSEAELETAYSQVVEMMSQLYLQCHLVHADLSEYNILWWEKEAWFIDVSQAVEPIHPSGLDFLLRDCINVYNVSLASHRDPLLNFVFSFSARKVCQSWSLTSCSARSPGWK